jgi:hypothetical protein
MVVTVVGTVVATSFHHLHCSAMPISLQLIVVVTLPCFTPARHSILIAPTCSQKQASLFLRLPTLLDTHAIDLRGNGSESLNDLWLRLTLRLIQTFGLVLRALCEL